MREKSALKDVFTFALAALHYFVDTKWKEFPFSPTILKIVSFKKDYCIIGGV